MWFEPVLWKIMPETGSHHIVFSAKFTLPQIGAVLTDTNVQALVDAMASFAPPALGETDLNPGAAYADPVTAAISANWQNP
jgi:hypothetical protein